jgi:hypothetical protein
LISKLTGYLIYWIIFVASSQRYSIQANFRLGKKKD